jgi:glycosyltransferase involved in cell wall biosynthesis
MKKTILHIIHDLKRGGAETILMTTIQELPEYNNVIVTLFDGFEFDERLKKNHTFICLHLKHFTFLPFYIFKFKKLLNENNVDVVHSRLFWPTVLARISTPKKISLITTIHTYVAGSVEYKKKLIRWIEKLTYRFHKTIMLADSEGALNEYFSFFKLKPYKAISPFTFVDTRVFKEGLKSDYKRGEVLKIITVGRLTTQKNHKYLVESFKQLDQSKFLLDIFGEGDRRGELQKGIDDAKLSIYLKGMVKEIDQLLPQYDLFVMPSLYEGFSLAVLEAMAIGMPMMLSDTLSFREQCDDTAIYFDLINPDDFSEKLNKLSLDDALLQSLGEIAKQRVLENFTLSHHMIIIRQVYKDAIESL